MGKIISNAANKYGLYSLHKKYSKSDQFSFVEDEVSALNSGFSKFYKKPILPKIHYEKEIIEKSFEKGKIKFLSEIKNGDSNKEAVFHYRRCTITDSNINVIFVHGWRTDNLNRLDKVFLNTFIEKSYNVYSYVLC